MSGPAVAEKQTGGSDKGVEAPIFVMQGRKDKPVPPADFIGWQPKNVDFNGGRKIVLDPNSGETVGDLLMQIAAMTQEDMAREMLAIGEKIAAKTESILKSME